MIVLPTFNSSKEVMATVSALMSLALDTMG